jgi:hypothetical protein
MNTNNIYRFKNVRWMIAIMLLAALALTGCVVAPTGEVAVAGPPVVVAPEPVVVGPPVVFVGGYYRHR